MAINKDDSAILAMAGMTKHVVKRFRPLCVLVLDDVEPWSQWTTRVGLLANADHGFYIRVLWKVP